MCRYYGPAALTNGTDSIPSTITRPIAAALALVSVLTENAKRDTDPQHYYHQPGGGSTGLIVSNQLNLNGGQGQELGGRFGLEASGSLGNWGRRRRHAATGRGQHL